MSTCQLCAAHEEHTLKDCDGLTPFARVSRPKMGRDEIGARLIAAAIGLSVVAYIGLAIERIVLS